MHLLPIHWLGRAADILREDRREATSLSDIALSYPQLESVALQQIRCFFRDMQGQNLFRGCVPIERVTAIGN